MLRSAMKDRLNALSVMAIESGVVKTIDFNSAIESVDAKKLREQY